MCFAGLQRIESISDFDWFVESELQAVSWGINWLLVCQISSSESIEYDWKHFLEHVLLKKKSIFTSH